MAIAATSIAFATAVGSLITNVVITVIREKSDRRNRTADRRADQRSTVGVPIREALSEVVAETIGIFSNMRTAIRTGNPQGQADNIERSRDRYDDANRRLRPAISQLPDAALSSGIRAFTYDLAEWHRKLVALIDAGPPMADWDTVSPEIIGVVDDWANVWEEFMEGNARMNRLIEELIVDVDPN